MVEALRGPGVGAEMLGGCSTGGPACHEQTLMLMVPVCVPLYGPAVSERACSHSASREQNRGNSGDAALFSPSSSPSLEALSLSSSPAVLQSCETTASPSNKMKRLREDRRFK